MMHIRNRVFLQPRMSCTHTQINNRLPKIPIDNNALKSPCQSACCCIRASPPGPSKLCPAPFKFYPRVIEYCLTLFFAPPTPAPPNKKMEINKKDQNMKLFMFHSHLVIIQDLNENEPNPNPSWTTRNSIRRPCRPRRRG